MNTNRIEMSDFYNDNSFDEGKAAERLSLSAWDFESLAKISNPTIPKDLRDSSLLESRLNGLASAFGQLNEMQITGLECGQAKPRDSVERKLAARDTTDTLIDTGIDGRGQVEVLEFRNLKNSYRNDGGPGTAPDATLIISKNFAPEKPVSVVFFNHGHSKHGATTHQYAGVAFILLMMPITWGCLPGILLESWKTTAGAGSSLHKADLKGKTQFKSSFPRFPPLWRPAIVWA